jgi:hypothetical protein
MDVMSYTALKNLQHELMLSHAMLSNWRKVGEKFGVRHPIAYRIAMQGYEPKDEHIRAILNLPVLIPTPACRRCGVVHIARRCPLPRHQEYRDIFATPAHVLRWQMENREEL